MRDLLTELMLIPGLSGYEERVAGCIARHLDGLGFQLGLWRDCFELEVVLYFRPVGPRD